MSSGEKYVAAAYGVVFVTVLVYVVIIAAKLSRLELLGKRLDSNLRELREILAS